MGETVHPPGNFCWVELGTTDQTGAKAFYSALFGWSWNDYPMGEAGMYTIFQFGAEDAAAAYALRTESGSAPPAWGLYVAVQSADRAAENAVRLGGTVLAAPFDVTDAGRMAPIADPSGAHFSVWEPKRNQGVGPVGDHGALCWADLQGPDAKRAVPFYEGLFGWTFMKGEKNDYLHIQNKDAFIGGVPLGNPGQAPPSWLPYFQVLDCVSSLGKAKGLGARVFLDPMVLANVGTMAVLADPQGACFALFEASR